MFSAFNVLLFLFNFQWNVYIFSNNKKKAVIKFDISTQFFRDEAFRAS